MNRKDFFKKACVLGFCSCVTPGLMASNNVLAKKTITRHGKKDL